MSGLCSVCWRATVTACFALNLAACTLRLDGVEPRPVQDLSSEPGQGVLTFDLRESAGVTVEVEGRHVDLVLLARAESLVALNRDIAGSLGLQSAMLGLGTAAVRDGDHRVSGAVRRARYRIAPGAYERAWVLDMEENFYPGYNGAISFGAIPASRFRILLNDAPPAGVEEVWVPMVLEGRSEALEQSRDYAALEFSHDLALYQEPVSANRKAVFYLHAAGRLVPISQSEPFMRLLNNVRPHVTFSVRPPVMVSGLPAGEILGEVDPEYDPFAPRNDEAGEVIVVHHDLRGTAYAPTLYLGRSFFSACSELLVVREELERDRQTVSARCRADALNR